jgi:hypothetical protein
MTNFGSRAGSGSVEVVPFALADDFESVKQESGLGALSMVKNCSRT